MSDGVDIDLYDNIEDEFNQVSSPVINKLCQAVLFLLEEISVFSYICTLFYASSIRLVRYYFTGLDLD